jgi:hypothetical protein
MPPKTATAHWTRSLSDGDGTLALGSGSFSGRCAFQLIMLARDRVIEHLQLAHKLATQPRLKG